MNCEPSFPATGNNHREATPAQQGNAGERTDLREQLFNEGEVGPIHRVQISAARIGQLIGIMCDLDPGLFMTGGAFSAILNTPIQFYELVIKPMLDRDPVLAQAEVRCSGTGLHVIIRFAKPVIFKNDAERERWSAICETIQAILPVDPDQPGITALTRPVGSINSKNGAVVEILAPGKPVAAAEVEALAERVCAAPFRSVFSVLFGRDRVSPCPVCKKPGTILAALDFAGNCYGSCGKVQLSKIYDFFLKPRESEKDAAADEGVADG
jgi:hypothetical protein